MSTLSGIESCLVVLQIRNLRLREFNSLQGLQGRQLETRLKPMKEFFGGSSPKGIFQAKLSSEMEKSNSDNPKGMKRNTQKKLAVERRDEKHYMQKENPQKMKERNTQLAMNMLYWRSKGIHTLFAQGVDFATWIQTHRWQREIKQ